MIAGGGLGDFRPEEMNAAQIFELDDVIDPADTRRAIALTLSAAGTPSPSGRTVDTW